MKQLNALFKSHGRTARIDDLRGSSLGFCLLQTAHSYSCLLCLHRDEILQTMKEILPGKWHLCISCSYWLKWTLQEVTLSSSELLHLDGEGYVLGRITCGSDSSPVASKHKERRCVPLTSYNIPKLWTWHYEVRVLNWFHARFLSTPGCIRHV